MKMDYVFRHRIGLGSIGLAIAAITAPTVQAELTHYLSFDDQFYVAGDELGVARSPDLGFTHGEGWFAPNTTVVAGSLAGPAGLPTQGNSGSINSDGGFNTAFYSFDQNGSGKGEAGIDDLQPGEHWVSFIARADAGVNAAALSFVKFFGGESLYIGVVDDGNGGKVWGLDTQTTDPNGGGDAIAGGGDITTDTFLVVRMVLGAGGNDDVADLWINPDITAGPPSLGTAAVAGAQFNEDRANNRGIDEIRLATENGSFYVDELRIGSTFADVAPIPEPTTLTLLGAGAAALLRRRRLA